MAARFNNIKEYFDFLEIKPLSNHELDLFIALTKHCSMQEANRIAEKFCDFTDVRRNHPEINNDDEFYKFINKTYEISLIISGGREYDRNLVLGDIFDLYNDNLGDTVFDLGCMNGLITCYLAAQNPNTKFVGYDSCWNAIQIANKLKEKLKLTNIEFIHKNMFYIKNKCDTAIDICSLKGNNSITTDYKKFSNLLHKILNNNGLSLSFERYSSQDFICCFFKENEVDELQVVELEKTGSSDSNIYGMITNLK